MPFVLPERCSNNVSSPTILANLLHNEPAREEMLITYKTLMKQFNLLCSGCNVVTNVIPHRMWLERIQQLMVLLTSDFILPRMNECLAFKTCIQNMLCEIIRCNNLPHWDGQLDQSFMNWLTHKVTYVALDLLDLDYTSSRGCGSYESGRMQEHLDMIVYMACDRQQNRGLKRRVQLAKLGFDLAHRIRQLRSSEQLPIPICPLHVYHSVRTHSFEERKMECYKHACDAWLDHYQ